MYFPQCFILQSLKHRLGKANVLARLGQPLGARSWRGAGRRFSMRELPDTSREGYHWRRVREGSFKPGFNFRSEYMWFLFHAAYE